jgi:hypothetical protein
MKPAYASHISVRRLMAEMRTCGVFYMVDSAKRLAFSMSWAKR